MPWSEGCNRKSLRIYECVFISSAIFHIIPTANNNKKRFLSVFSAKKPCKPNDNLRYFSLSFASSLTNPLKRMSSSLTLSMFSLTFLVVCFPLHHVLYELQLLSSSLETCIHPSIHLNLYLPL